MRRHFGGTKGGSCWFHPNVLHIGLLLGIFRLFVFPAEVIWPTLVGLLISYEVDLFQGVRTDHSHFSQG